MFILFVFDKVFCRIDQNNRRKRKYDKELSSIDGNGITRNILPMGDRIGGSDLCMRCANDYINDT